MFETIAFYEGKKVGNTFEDFLAVDRSEHEKTRDEVMGISSAGMDEHTRCTWCKRGLYGDDNSCSVCGTVSDEKLALIKNRFVTDSDNIRNCSSSSTPRLIQFP